MNALQVVASILSVVAVAVSQLVIWALRRQVRELQAAHNADALRCWDQAYMHWATYDGHERAADLAAKVLERRALAVAPPGGAK